MVHAGHIRHIGTIPTSTSTSYSPFLAPSANVSQSHPQFANDFDMSIFPDDQTADFSMFGSNRLITSLSFDPVEDQLQLRAPDHTMSQGGSSTISPLIHMQPLQRQISSVSSSSWSISHSSHDRHDAVNVEPAPFPLTVCPCIT